jgi:hypothetical protein
MGRPLFTNSDAAYCRVVNAINAECTLILASEMSSSTEDAGAGPDTVMVTNPHEGKWGWRFSIKMAIPWA